jgi:hypothetical protein
MLFNAERVAAFQRRIYRFLYGRALSDRFFRPEFVYVGAAGWLIGGFFFVWSGLQQL